HGGWNLRLADFPQEGHDASPFRRSEIGFRIEPLMHDDGPPQSRIKTGEFPSDPERGLAEDELSRLVEPIRRFGRFGMGRTLPAREPVEEIDVRGRYISPGRDDNAPPALDPLADRRKLRPLELPETLFFENEQVEARICGGDRRQVFGEDRRRIG